MASDPNWIEQAFAKPGSKGKFAGKAKAAGVSTSALADRKSGASGAIGKEARMAQTLGKLRPKKSPVAMKMGAALMGK